jgi:hypothetical protein
MDLHRARTPVPRRHLTASNFESRSHMFNEVLVSTDGLMTRACEDYSLDELMGLRSTLLSIASADLNHIYETGNDNRKLSRSTAGSKFVPQDESLAPVMRDALCVEAVNLYVHHLMENDKAEFHALSSLPLMPKSEHVREGSRSLSDEEYGEIFNSYEEALVCNICHQPLNDETIVEPNAPRYPDTYYAVMSVNEENLADGSAIGSSVIRYYNWPRRAVRNDEFYDDGTYKFQLHIETVLYTIYPVTQECEAADPGFGVLAPYWMQSGPEGTQSVKLEDAVVNGIECEVWDRAEPNTGDPHTLSWSKATNAPVQRLSRGGPAGLKIADHLAFIPNFEIDPTIYALPEYCFGKMIYYPDMQCRVDNYDRPAEWDELCGDSRPPTHVKPTFGNEELDRRNGISRSSSAVTTDSTDMQTATVAGLAVAGIIFAVAGLIVVLRFKGRQNLYDPHLLLDFTQEVQSLELGTSVKNLSQPQVASV